MPSRVRHSAQAFWVSLVAVLGVAALRRGGLTFRKHRLQFAS